ncbi:hypothetical protein [Erythrobacter sp.]|uniref:hypothetical protein n=1 Tax=Erythrobacter sp. TaxID=1042 RepID=UPI001425C18B|nr:hypothetical protein [Erythrobacter sp.]QIQ86786.1 MAG: hypothetical protein G9473_08865 [Erythrobacter sp.]
MKKIAILTSLIGCLTAIPAGAQETYQWPATETSTELQKFYFSRGTPVELQTTHLISTKDFEPGDRVYLEVAEPLMFRGQTIVPAGTRVRGEVATVQRNGHFGRKGKIEIRLVSMVTPHGPVRVSGSEYDEGESGAVASFGTMLLVSGLGFIIKGTSGYIQPGTPVTARLDEDLQFTYNPSARSLARKGAEVFPDGTRTAAPGFSLRD